MWSKIQVGYIILIVKMCKKVTWVELKLEANVGKVVRPQPGKIFQVGPPNKATGQSHKAPTSVNYNSTVAITSKLLIFTTLDS